MLVYLAGRSSVIPSVKLFWFLVIASRRTAICLQNWLPPRIKFELHRKIEGPSFMLHFQCEASRRAPAAAAAPAPRSRPRRPAAARTAPHAPRRRFLSGRLAQQDKRRRDDTKDTKEDGNDRQRTPTGRGSTERLGKKERPGVKRQFEIS